MTKLATLCTVFVMALLFLLGCEGDRGATGPPGTSLGISSVNATPFIVAGGDTSVIIVSVTYWGDGILEYTWVADGGTFIGTGPEVRWRAPEIAGDYVVSVTVSDGEYDATGHVTIHVQSGLVAYYPFNGDADDESGNENHGSVNGATLTVDRFGNPNSAYSFDGADDYVAVPHSAWMNFGRDDFSVCFWISLDKMPDKDVRVVGKYGASRTSSQPGDGFGYGVAIRTNGYSYVDITEDGVGAIAQWTVPLELGTWYFLAAVRDNGTLNFFVNGDLKSTTTNMHDGDSRSVLEIGASKVGIGDVRWFWGSMDDIRIYNHALTAERIESLFEEGS